MLRCKTFGFASEQIRSCKASLLLGNDAKLCSISEISAEMLRSEISAEMLRSDTPAEAFHRSALPVSQIGPSERLRKPKQLESTSTRAGAKQIEWRTFSASENTKNKTKKNPTFLITFALVSKKRLKQKFKEDFFNGKLSPFFGYAFPDFTWEKVIAKRLNFKQENRRILREVLERQHKELPHFETIKKSLRKITDPNTFFVTTGQQPGLFLGPLYTFYKALDAIYFARKLSEHFPDKTFLPLFWTASEDHDYKEINHCYITPAKKWEYKEDFQNNIVGEHLITNEIQKFPLFFPEIQKYWKQGKKWSLAFRQSLAELLTAQGLLILDPNEKSLKKSAFPYFEKALRKNIFYNATQAQTQELLSAGYYQQLQLSEVPFFKISPEGRVRMKREELVRLSPENISPDASFRPVYQEIILPNIAYIGGWGELAYWAQLKKGFEVLNVPFPLVFPRSSYVLLPSHFSLPDGVTPEDLPKPLPVLRKKFATKFLPENFWKDLECPEIISVNPFPGFAELQASFQKKQKKLLDNFRKKTLRHITRTFPKEWQKITEARYFLYPEKQERVWSLLTLKKAEIPWQEFLQKVSSSYEPQGKIWKF